MSLADLKSFDAVARHGGFVAAAKFLARAQPTITAQIRNLEKRYGVELFYRGRGQQAKLTPFGAQLFETTQQLFNLERDAADLLENAGLQRGGFLRIGAISPRWALPIMVRASKRFPGLALNLKIANSHRLVESLRNHELDVCFLGLRHNDPVISTRKISSPEIVLAAPMSENVPPDGLIDRESFAKLTLLQREEGSETRSLIEANLLAHGYRPRRSQELGGRESILLAVQSGLGIAPVSLDEVGPGDRVRIMRCADFRTFGEIHFACLTNRFHLPIIRTIFDYVQDIHEMEGKA